MTTKEALLATLRDAKTPSALFRKTTSALSTLLAKEATDLKPTVLVPILRAGLSLLPAFASAFPEAPIGILGIKRDEKTAQASKYYEKLPPFTPNDHIVILDPMLATGGTARLALTTLINHGAAPSKITLIGIIASTQGIASTKEAYPQVTLNILATDPDLSSGKMILPGLGDFGDRYFGTL